jgi:hypothetical protein
LRFPKVYGQSSVNACPFCGGQAYLKNKENVPVCKKHTACSLPDLKCVCGSWLDARESKFGVFFVCMNCGPVSFSKMMALNSDALMKASTVKVQERPVHTMSSSPNLSMKLRVQEKMRRGDPLTPDELEYL